MVMKRVFQYKNGKLFWKIRPANCVQIGDEAGCLHRGERQGYWVLTYQNHYYRRANIVWYLHKGRWPKKELDHINRDRADDRIENLREVTRAQNCQNKGTPKNNTSGYKGVIWHKGDQKWHVYKQRNGKRKFLGAFDNIEKAAQTYEAH